MSSAEELDQEIREHLQKLPPIEAATRPFVSIEPLGSKPVPALNFQEMSAAFAAKREWEDKFLQLMRERWEMRSQR